MAKNKSVYEIMGDPSDIAKPDEYEVRASATPSDHFVNPKSAQTLLAESKDFKKAATMSALAKTFTSGLQTAAKIKTQQDAYDIKSDLHSVNTLALKDQYKYDNWVQNNQADYKSMTIPERDDKRLEFFEETFTFLKNTHEDVQFRFNTRFDNLVYAENKSMYDDDFEKYVNTKIDPEFNALDFYPKNISKASLLNHDTDYTKHLDSEKLIDNVQNRYNYSVDLSIERLKESTGLDYTELNNRFAKKAIANLVNDDPRLYNWAKNKKIYSTAKNVDSGLLELSNKKFLAYKARNLKNEQQDQAGELATYFDNAGETTINQDSEKLLIKAGINPVTAKGIAETTVYNVDYLKTSIDAWQEKNEQLNGEGYAALINTATAKIKVGDYDLYTAIKNIKDHRGEKIFKSSLYAKEIALLNQADETYRNKVEPTITKKQIVQGGSDAILEDWLNGSDDFSIYENRNFSNILGADNPNVPPVYFNDGIKSLATNKILEHEQKQLTILTKELIGLNPDDPTYMEKAQEFLNYENKVTTRFRNAGITNPAWQQEIKIAGEILADGKEVDDEKLDQILRGLIRYSKLQKVSPHYVNNTGDAESQQVFETLIKNINIKNAPFSAMFSDDQKNNLKHAIEQAQKEPINIPEEDVNWIRNSVEAFIGELGEQEFTLFNTGRNIGHLHGINQIYEAIRHQMQKAGDTKEDALYAIIGTSPTLGEILRDSPDSWFNQNFKVITTEDERESSILGYIPWMGEDFNHVIDKRPFKHFNSLNGIPIEDADNYLEVSLPEYLTELASRINGNDSLKEQVTIIPRGNDFTSGYILQDIQGDAVQDANGDLITFDIKEFYDWANTKR